MKNTGLTIFLGMILIQAVYCQEVDLYTPFTPQKNNVIQKFDTLNIRECYNLDKSNSIGVVFRYWQVDMWVSLFRDNRSNVTISDFDTINVTDSTRFHFYQTQDPADGIVIIWESRYDY